MEEEYLLHYGVLGMKWGVRKQRRAAVKAFNKKKKEQNDRAIAKTEAKLNVKKYGSKREAVKKMTRNAETAASARKKVKQGSLLAASVLSSSAGALSLAQAAAAVTWYAGMGITATINPTIPLAYLAVGTASAVAAGKAKKKVSKRANKQIENVKKYG